MKRIQREKLSSEVLNEASKLLAREIKSLRLAVDTHEKYLLEGGHPAIVMNGLIKLFALSFRNILDFMYMGKHGNRSPKSTDVVAEDFFDSDEEWHMALPPYPERARATRHRLNKQIAHLTYEQIYLADQERTWDFDRMLDDLSPSIQAFYRKVNWSYYDEVADEFKHPLWNRRVRMLFQAKHYVL